MNENNKKFLNKLYDDMVINNIISNNVVSDRDSKIKIVNDYISRISRIENKVLNYKESLRILKEFYYDKYVIKKEDISDNYYMLQNKINLEKGLGELELNNLEKDKIARSVIIAQKKSLDKWLDYFLSNDSLCFSYKLKYWAFQGVIKMGKYDDTKKEFMRRNKKTTAPFLEFNKETISLILNDMTNYLNNEDIKDLELKKLLGSFKFSKIYNYYNNKSKKKNNYDNIDGIWIKYNRYGDYKALSDSLNGMNTGWCSASLEVARIQLNDGDFYVYYTKDNNGEYRVPRIAIKTKFGELDEIRGINKYQNIESNMEGILEEKLKEFPDRDKFYKKIDDMRLMSKIYHKYLNKEMLDKEELIFLYEIKSIINGFGEEKDPRIEIVKNSRNIFEDLMVIFNLDKDEITSSYKELVENNDKIKCFVGNLELDDKDISFDKLEIIYGNAYFDRLKSTNNIRNIKYIVGNANLSNIKNSTNLNKLEYIIGNACFYSLNNAIGLENLKYIGKDASFDNIYNLDGLDNLEIIEGDAEFKNLKVLGTNKLKYIGGDAYFDNIEDIRELDNIKINGVVFSNENFYKGRMI